MGSYDGCWSVAMERIQRERMREGGAWRLWKESLLSPTQFNAETDNIAMRARARARIVNFQSARRACTYCMCCRTLHCSMQN